MNRWLKKLCILALLTYLLVLTWGLLKKPVKNEANTRILQTSSIMCNYVPEMNRDKNFKYDLNDSILSFERIRENLKGSNINISQGGLSLSIKNFNCISKTNVAIIIPYRDRLDHLKVFVHNMHRILTKQKKNYCIYVIEQSGYELFNRALLMNIGFIESIKDEKKLKLKWNCFIFHDVDFLPEDARNLYECDPEYPKHMAVAVEQYEYRTDGYWGENYYGGVFAATREQFLKINGLSNLFFGWGKEDDNLLERVKLKFGIFKKISPNIGRYHTLDTSHNRVKPKSRFKLLKSSNKLMHMLNGTIAEGLTSINYQITNIRKHELFTIITASFSKKLVYKKLNDYLKARENLKLNKKFF